jgi:hypothetical protein
MAAEMSGKAKRKPTISSPFMTSLTRRGSAMASSRSPMARASSSVTGQYSILCANAAL